MNMMLSQGFCRVIKRSSGHYVGEESSHSLGCYGSTWGHGEVSIDLTDAAIVQLFVPAVLMRAASESSIRIFMQQSSALLAAVTFEVSSTQNLYACALSRFKPQTLLALNPSLAVLVPPLPKGALLPR